MGWINSHKNDLFLQYFYTNKPFCRDLTQVRRQTWVGGFFSCKQLLSQFVGVDFPDLNPSSYVINNMKFDLNVSTKVKFNANDHGL